MVMQNALVVRMRTFREGDLMRLRLVLPILLLPAVLAAGCAGGDDQDDSLPPVDGDPTSSNSDETGASKGSSGGDSGGSKPSDDPTYSPAPKGANLAKDEMAAYKAAVRDYEHWSAVASRLERNPHTNRKTHRQV